MIKSIRFVLLLSFFLVACRDVYRNFEGTSDLRWYKNDIKKFDVRIREKANYDIYFAIRYTTGFPKKQISVRISQITPEGKDYYKDAVFNIIDNNSRYVGEVAGNIWDFEECIAENQNLAQGDYQFKIEHTMPDDPMILVVDVGLIVRKTKD